MGFDCGPLRLRQELLRPQDHDRRPRRPAQGRGRDPEGRLSHPDPPLLRQPPHHGRSGAPGTLLSRQVQPRDPAHCHRQSGDRS